MESIKNNFRQYGMIVALIAIAVLFQVLTNGILLMPINITNLVLQNAYILILAIGMVLVIVTGNIDLSVGSIAGFIGAIAGVFMVRMGLPVWLAIILCLSIGGLAGVFQGYFIAYRGIPAFIVTLAGMLVFRGLNMATLMGQTISPFPTSFQAISQGFIPNFFGGNVNIIAFVLSGLASVCYILIEMHSRKSSKFYGIAVSSNIYFVIKLAIIAFVINLFGYWFAVANGVPFVLILLAVLILFYSFIANKTIVGRHIYAYGGNPKAAELSGIKTKRVVLLVYINMGILSALAGLVFAARLNAATPQAGNAFELDAIAAAFIGGASAMGGVGKVTGAIIGAMVMGILNNGMSIMGIGVDIQQIITGLVLLGAVIFDVSTKNKG
ncbi:MAG: sugar ABC transporter permease [Firmicutes bacterium]|nr:sugar ABC transporter permease [Bacillota bacterium]